MTALREKLSYLFWEIGTTWVPLKCLNTNAGETKEDLEVCMQLQVCSLSRIRDVVK